MKRAIFLAATLLLTSCANSTTVESKGKVISCTSVATDRTVTKGTAVECIDGSHGALLESLRGPMIVNVWGSWCAPCLDEIPIFESFYGKASGKVQLVGVAVEEANAKDPRTFIETHGMTWPNFYDRNNKTRGYFGMGVPVTWFIDASGKVKFKKIGVISSEAELIQLTSKYLGVKI